VLLGLPLSLQSKFYGLVLYRNDSDVTLTIISIGLLTMKFRHFYFGRRTTKL
jgi:hypothetical protein